MVNTLICSPSPRDISDVKVEMDKVVSDKAFAKYYPEKEAYSLLRDYFLDHKTYTHMVIAPDDLIVTPRAFNTLKTDIMLNDFPVLAGLCNLFYSDIIAHTNYLLMAKRYACAFHMNKQDWLTDESIHAIYKETKDHFFKVEHEGFACTFIRRDVVEQIPFHGEPTTSFDIAFSRDCMKKGIPIRVNILVRMAHLANRFNRYEKWGRDLKHPRFKVDLQQSHTH